MSTVREVTYQVLRDLGMPLIFGNPGSTELPFLRDMPADFRYVLALHERAAAGMALGYALAKGKAVVVNLHSITGGQSKWLKWREPAQVNHQRVTSRRPRNLHKPECPLRVARSARLPLRDRRRRCSG